MIVASEPTPVTRIPYEKEVALPPSIVLPFIVGFPALFTITPNEVVAEVPPFMLLFEITGFVPAPRIITAFDSVEPAPPVILDGSNFLQRKLCSLPYKALMELEEFREYFRWRLVFL